MTIDPTKTLNSNINEFIANPEPIETAEQQPQSYVMFSEHSLTGFDRAKAAFLMGYRENFGFKLSQLLRQKIYTQIDLAFKKPLMSPEEAKKEFGVSINKPTSRDFIEEFYENEIKKQKLSEILQAYSQERAFTKDEEGRLGETARTLVAGGAGLLADPLIFGSGILSLKIAAKTGNYLKLADTFKNKFIIGGLIDAPLGGFIDIAFQKAEQLKTGKDIDYKSVLSWSLASAVIGGALNTRGQKFKKIPKTKESSKPINLDNQLNKSREFTRSLNEILQTEEGTKLSNLYRNYEAFIKSKVNKGIEAGLATGKFKSSKKLTEMIEDVVNNFEQIEEFVGTLSNDALNILDTIAAKNTEELNKLYPATRQLSDKLKNKDHLERTIIILTKTLEDFQNTKVYKNLQSLKGFK